MSGLRKGCLYVGIRGHVVALDAATGAELWRTKLKGSDYVSVTADAAHVYAATRGETFALEPHAGSILWHNKMRGLGLGLVGLLTETGGIDSAAGAAAAQELQRQRARAAGGAG